MYSFTLAAPAPGVSVPGRITSARPATDVAWASLRTNGLHSSPWRAARTGRPREPTAQDRAAEAAQKGLQFHESYEIPDNVRYSLQFWGETEWIDMQSGLFHRWVFQPSGMCEPLRIRVESDGAFFEVEFHPLTGDVKREQSWVE